MFINASLSSHADPSCWQPPPHNISLWVSISSLFAFQLSIFSYFFFFKSKSVFVYLHWRKDYSHKCELVTVALLSGCISSVMLRTVKIAVSCWVTLHINGQIREAGRGQVALEMMTSRQCDLCAELINAVFHLLQKNFCCCLWDTFFMRLPHLHVSAGTPSLFKVLFCFAKSSSSHILNFFPRM